MLFGRKNPLEFGSILVARIRALTQRIGGLITQRLEF